MFESMPGQSSVIGLKIYTHLLLQSKPLEKAVDGSGIEIILMCSWFLGLGLDEDLSVEAYLVFVVDDQHKETAHLFEFVCHVGVQQRLIAFTAAPQDVVSPSESLRNVHAMLHSGRTPREDGWIRIG